MIINTFSNKYVTYHGFTYIVAIEYIPIGRLKEIPQPFNSYCLNYISLKHKVVVMAVRSISSLTHK